MSILPQQTKVFNKAETNQQARSGCVKIHPMILIQFQNCDETLSRRNCHTAVIRQLYRWVAKVVYKK